MVKILKLSRIIFQKFCFINIVGLTVKIQINLITENQCRYLPVDLFYVSASYGLSQNETVEKYAITLKYFFPSAGKIQNQQGKNCNIQHQGNNSSYSHLCWQDMSLPQIVVQQHTRNVWEFSFFSLFFTMRAIIQKFELPIPHSIPYGKNDFSKKQDTNNLPERNLRPLLQIQLLIKIFFLLH